MRLFVVGLVAAIATVPGQVSADGDTFRLEPKWSVGEQVRVKLVTEAFGTADDLTTNLVQTRTVEYEEKVTKAEGGLRMRVTRHFTRFEFKDAIDNKVRKQKLAGKWIEFVRQDGVLRFKSYTDAEKLFDARDFTSGTMGGGADWTWLLPDRAVAIGESWKVRSGRPLLSVHKSLGSGETTCELVRVDDGVALVRFHKPDTKWGNSMEGFRGEASFSIEAGRVVKGFIETSATWLDPRKGPLAKMERLTFEQETLPDKRASAKKPGGER